jgi:hypothetical protein
LWQRPVRGFVNVVDIIRCAVGIHSAFPATRQRCSHVGLGWIGLDWIGLDWIGLDWIGLDWIGLDWIGFVVVKKWYANSDCEVGNG